MLLTNDTRVAGGWPKTLVGGRIENRNKKMLCAKVRVVVCAVMRRRG